MTKEYYKSADFSNKKFDIRNYVEFDANGRAVCPNCGDTSAKGKKNLSVTNGGQYDGAYKCFKCNDTEAIREALGQPIRKIIPTALARPQSQAKSKSKYLVGEEAIQKDSANLLSAHSQVSFSALNWLKSRGISPEIAKEFKLGLARAKVDNKWYWAISIPIPDEGKYHRKKRLVPWQPEDPIQGVRPWSQAGIPKISLFTHSPKTPKETWLCEGEWDAMLLGWLVKHHDPENIAVASFTCGCKAIPDEEELNKLPGEVKIFYDRNDIFIGNERVGDKAAKDVAIALGERAKIAEVPMPESCDVQGWDVSDAINRGFRFEDFQRAASAAKAFKTTDRQQTESATSASVNPLRQYMTSYWDVMQYAPDFVDWLVYEILSPNELFLLAAPPRAGKSLLALSIAKAVASGGEFLGRPTKQGKVLYINMEDSQGKVKRRLIAQEWSEEEARNVTEINRFTLDQIVHLEEIIKEEKYSLVVIDTLSRVRRDGYSENSSEMANAIAPLQDIAAQYNCCILLVHHTRKQGLDKKEADDVFDSVRGSGAIRATCRGMLVLAKTKKDYRLVIENGETEGQDLFVKLNPADLTWKLLGKWNLNVNLSQKDRVIKYLGTYSPSSLEDIAEATGIPKRSLYQVLIRLIRDKTIVRQNSTNSCSKTLYYALEDSQLVDNLLTDPRTDTEIDTADSTKSTKNFQKKLSEEKSYQQPDNFQDSDNFSGESKNFVDSEGVSYQDTSQQGIQESTTRQQNVNLLTNSQVSYQNSDNFDCSTKIFDEKVINDDNHSGFTEFVSERQNCTNKMLTGVRTKDERYYIVIREKKDGVDCRRAGETKRLFVSWDEIEDYEYKTVPKE